MTKIKSTKRALISSVVALLVCFSMLIGTTFAWFTDSVTSAGNKIMSGTLKVDLELLDKANGWESIKESKAPIFNYDKWEPGYTDVKILKIENEGTLALKWKARFVSDSELSILADVIDVYVLPSATELTYPDTRDLESLGYEKVGTVRDFVNTIETTTKGNLEAGEVAYLGIALKMQESANNDYQGLDLGGAFDILILATQLDSEEDSFGNDYDADAVYPSLGDKWDGTIDDRWYDESADELVIQTAEELASFATLVNGGNTFAGKTVKIADHINLTNKEWTPIGGATPFMGTFDGQNHTISNITINVNDSTKTQYLGLFGTVNNAIIKNLTVEKVSITAVGKTVYAAAVVGYHTQADGVTSTLDNVNVNNATIDAKATTPYVGGVFGFCSKGNMAVTNSTVNGLKITSNATGGRGYTGGLIGYTYKVDPMKVENVHITGLDIDFIGRGESYVGGVTGCDESVSRDNSGYKNVTVSGTIDENLSSGSGSSVGGFLGISYQYSNAYIDCTADVDVSGGNRAGGFVGTVAINAWSGQTETYTNCTAKGDAKGPYAGGFVGCAWLNASANSTLVLSGVKAEGSVAATNQGGGLIGSAWGSGNACSNIIIKDSVAAKTVTGPQVGGVVGAHSMGSGKKITLENVTSYISPEIR